jgi:hypothetical protein|eukprot:COSAG02_NODE_1893_length_10476_cov_3.336224_8_plen_79_part_00
MEHEDHDAFEERVKIVKLLIDKGADLNAVTRVRRHPVLADDCCLLLTGRLQHLLCPHRLVLHRSTKLHSMTSKTRPRC